MVNGALTHTFIYIYRERERRTYINIYIYIYIYTCIRWPLGATKLFAICFLLVSIKLLAFAFGAPAHI